MKFKNSNAEIYSNGGLIPIIRKMVEYGIPNVIKSVLGTRVKQCKYEFHDVILTWAVILYCGRKSLWSIEELKTKLPKIEGLKIPSHDTLGRVMKKLATSGEVSRNISRNQKAKERLIDYNENILLNKMLINATKKIGALKEGLTYTVDIDATFLASQCRGAESRNKKHGKLGFTPMVCLIGGMPVYVHLSSGDAGSRFKVKEALANCLDLLEQAGIKVGRVVSDAAGFTRAITDMLHERGIKFVMRFPVLNRTAPFYKIFDTVDWKATEIETANDVWKCEIGEFKYNMYYGKKEKPTTTVRVIAIRIPDYEEICRTKSIEERLRRRKIKNKMYKLTKEKRLKQPTKKYTDEHWKKIGNHTYKFYVTSDFDKSLEQLVVEYNKRGNAERKFSFMKQDFAWKYPPFQWLSENTVFLVLSALANNLYLGMLSILKEFIPEIRLNARLSTFRAIFIDVACRFDGETCVFFSRKIPYDRII